MSHEVVNTDELLSLLRGDVDRESLDDSVAHLRECDACRQELVKVLPVHGSLAAAARLFQQLPIAGFAGTTQPDQPPQFGRAQLQRAADPEGPGTVLPVLTGIRRKPQTRAFVARRALAVAASIVAIGFGGYVALGGLRPEAEPRGNSVAGTSVPLRPLDSQPAAYRDARGEVTMAASAATSSGTQMDVAVKLRPAKSGEFYYAWLLDPKTNKMLPLGVVTDRAQFTIPADLVADYSMVDISLEANDGDAVHSATSVLRASY